LAQMSCLPSSQVRFFFFSCAALAPARSLFGPLHENRKAKPAAGSGGDVDAMAQNSGRLAHNEESDADALASRCFGAAFILQVAGCSRNPLKLQIPVRSAPAIVSFIACIVSTLETAFTLL
jgi:hypothetical protein